MRLKSFLYKLVNRVCSADITNVMILPFRAFIELDTPSSVHCSIASIRKLRELAVRNELGVDERFVEECNHAGYQSIIASINCEVVGICFLAHGHIPAKYNSGGKNFNGIPIITPKSCRYLFKVKVRQAYRGQRIYAAMLKHAINALQTQGVSTLVTTTEWNNYSYLKSAGRLGFVSSGFACEIAVVGKQFTLLPKPIDAFTGQAISNARKIKIKAVCLCDGTIDH